MIAHFLAKVNDKRTQLEGWCQVERWGSIARGELPELAWAKRVGAGCPWTDQQPRLGWRRFGCKKTTGARRWPLSSG